MPQALCISRLGALNEEIAAVNHKFVYVWNFVVNFRATVAAQYNTYTTNLACIADYKEFIKGLDQLLNDYDDLLIPNVGVIHPIDTTICTDGVNYAAFVDPIEANLRKLEVKVEEFYQQAILSTRVTGALGGKWRLCGEIVRDVPPGIGAIPSHIPVPDA